MSWVFGVVAVSLGIFFLWGLLAPRSHWRAFSAWSVTDSYAHEPGGASYGWRRLLSALGVLGLATVGVVSATPELLAALPQETRVASPVSVMWGTPEPQLVDRSVYGSSTVPAGLVEAPVLGYQDLDELNDLPTYLLTMRHFSLLGDESPAGYIGSDPGEGFSGVGPADFVVNVRGSVLCIPRSAVVIETDTTVQVAIYYGLPDAKPLADGTPGAVPDSTAGCPADDPNSGSVLIPITLSAELGDRTVETLSGDTVPKVKLAE